MFLDRIVATKHKEVAALAERFTLAEAEKKIAAMPACRGFIRALTEGRKRRMGLIAEVKKASPSKGLIREDFHPVTLAKAYEEARTDCLSVLTDRDYFQGSNEYLQQVRAAVEVPILRKDFTIDYRHIYEARLIGADAVLLIAAILTTEQMREYLQLSRDLGLDALVEVHDEEELGRALKLSSPLLGINNRNLKTFEVDIALSEKLAPLVPADRLLVGESGIFSHEDCVRLAKTGISTFLVGESLMRKDDVTAATRALLTGSAGILAAE